MSRAFTREKDGWYYCVKEHDFCMFATETGKCALPECEIKKEEEKTDA
jgi:hypothetical protein